MDEIKESLSLDDEPSDEELQQIEDEYFGIKSFNPQRFDFEDMIVVRTEGND